jgi:hypothetical protein
MNASPTTSDLYFSGPQCPPTNPSSNFSKNTVSWLSAAGITKNVRILKSHQISKPRSRKKLHHLELNNRVQLAVSMAQKKLRASTPSVTGNRYARVWPAARASSKRSHQSTAPPTSRTYSQLTGTLFVSKFRPPLIQRSDGVSNSAPSISS